jgi:hypothetical protein
MKAYYAAVSPSGQLLGLKDSADAAVKLVEGTVGGPIAVQVLPDDGPANNPIAAEQMPVFSERNCQIGKISRDAVLAMDLAEAHLRLKPFFSGLVIKGAETTKYNTPSGMADAWIGQNYKTAKPSQDPGRPAEVMGLTLVPAFHARLASLGEGPYERLFVPGKDDDAAQLKTTERAMLKRWTEPGIGLPERITPKFTWCQGSSQECRDSCLVFAGQNASSRYNTYRKIAQTMALLNQPVAFMRILIESIELWLHGCDFYQRKHKAMELAPFFRMNVLSDIPWERLAPWFFGHFSRSAGENGKPLRFYDYTKVPGRRGMAGFPRNYDLTFSISGEDSNEQYAIEEIERYDSRIAVVFLAHRREDGKWQTYLEKGKEAHAQVPLPNRFQIGKHSLRVVDGDKSDVRPHDPGRTCVGLRWKTPSGKRSGVDPNYENMSFVTPIYVKSASKPSSYEPNPDDADAVLISAVTPRHEPIEQTLTQAG